MWFPELSACEQSIDEHIHGHPLSDKGHMYVYYVYIYMCIILINFPMNKICLLTIPIALDDLTGYTSNLPSVWKMPGYAGPSLEKPPFCIGSRHHESNAAHKGCNDQEAHHNLRQESYAPLVEFGMYEWKQRKTPSQIDVFGGSHFFHPLYSIVKVTHFHHQLSQQPAKRSYPFRTLLLVGIDQNDKGWLCCWAGIYHLWRIIKRSNGLDDWMPNWTHSILPAYRTPIATDISI